MPLMDSVVWAYCKDAVINLLDSEQRVSVQEQIEDLDRKIENINKAIQNYNIEDLIRGEESIFRSKITLLKGRPEAIQAAEIEFKQHLEQIDKQVKEFLVRKNSVIQRALFAIIVAPDTF